MAKIEARLIKPLDGHAEGETRLFDKVDFEQLFAMGAVKAARQPANKRAARPANKSA